MGGDHAPGAVVAGALEAVQERPVPLLLVGQATRIESELRRLGAPEKDSRRDFFEIVHSDEVVGMDEPPTTSVRRKKGSSVRVCAELVHHRRAGSMVTAGNTGAALVAAKVVLGTIQGVDRPALAAEMPNPHGRTLVLDVGANVATRASHLQQFAIMGHFYTQLVRHVAEPRIGLMSIGEEDSKGTGLTREVSRVLRGTGLHFVGNVEGRDVFNGKVDVVVCDGFVGNVLLKGAEEVAELVATMLNQELERTARTRLGAMLAQPAFDRLSRRIDYREYGAGPMLGLNGGCFIAHGRSNATAIRSSILRAAEFAETQVHIKIRQKVSQLRSGATYDDSGPRSATSSA